MAWVGGLTSFLGPAVAYTYTCLESLPMCKMRVGCVFVQCEHVRYTCGKCVCMWGYVCCGWCVYTCNVQGERKREMERVRVWQYGGCRDQEMLPKEATYPVSGGCRTLAHTHTLFLRTGPLELLTSVPDSLPILGLKTNPSKEEKQGSYQHLNMPRGPRWGGARRVCWWPLASW